MAAEDTEASLKGLPNAKTTRYIEMGKSEMEVSERREFLGRPCWVALIDRDFWAPYGTAIS